MEKTRTNSGTVTAAVAHKIMGNNYFGVEQGCKHFGKLWSPEVMGSLSNVVPWSRAVLEARKDSHFLVAPMGPLTILDIQCLCTKIRLYSPFNPNLLNWGGWSVPKFLDREQLESRWYLIRKTPAEGTVGVRDCEKQYSLIRPGDEPVKACVLVSAMIGHFLECGEYLFENTWLKCDDRVYTDILSWNRSAVGGHGVRYLAGTGTKTDRVVWLAMFETQKYPPVMPGLAVARIPGYSNRG